MAEMWRNEQTVAWTDHDGPGRPPRSPSQACSLAVACTLGAVFLGMMSTDTLCPEHRAWVHSLATAACAGAVVAIVGVFRGWVAVPVVTFASAACGVAIGLIDAVHAPTRGWLIAVGFGVSGVLAVVLGLQAMRLAWWERRALRELSDDPVDSPTASAPTDSLPAPTERASTAR